jgi:hypothetical protein
VTDPISQPYKTQGKIIVVYILSLLQTANELSLMQRKMGMLRIKIRQSGIYKTQISHFTMGHLFIRRSLQSKNKASCGGYRFQCVTQHMCPKCSTNFI